MKINWGERELELCQVTLTSWELAVEAWLLAIWGHPSLSYRASLAHDNLTEEITTAERYDTPQEAADALREALEAML